MALRFLSRNLVACAMCGAFLVAGAEVQAQTNSLFGANGAMSGASGMGTASANNLGSSSSGMGGAAMQSSAFPATAFPAGGANTSGTSMGGTAMGAQQGMAGAAGGQRTGLVGQQNTRFVGMAAAGQQQAGQMNQFNNRQGQNRNTNRNQAQNQNQNQAGAGASNQRTIRPQLTVNFKHPMASSEKTSTILLTRFEKLSKRTDFKGITIDANGSRVTLRGEVDSAETGRLAAMLTRLEPGVRSVQNELTVTKAPSPDSETETD